MKTPFLDERFCLEKQFYPNGVIKTKIYMLHMAYIVYRFREDGTCSRIVINGTEYPPNTRLKIVGKELEIETDA